MGFISLGKIDRNLIPILIGCIFSFLSRLLFTYKDTINIFKNAKKEITKGKWNYIFLSSIIFFIQGLILFFTIKIKTNVYIWNILITCIFSYIVFKIKLFMHHYLSIILINGINS